MDLTKEVTAKGREEDTQYRTLLDMGLRMCIITYLQHSWVTTHITQYFRGGAAYEEMITKHQIVYCTHTPTDKEDSQGKIEKAAG